jgi:glycosyltransferase involved in cell wall biosynthesis
MSGGRGPARSADVADPEIVIATITRRESLNGVQAHITHVASLLDAVRPVASSVVSPFSSRSPMLWPVFAIRFLLAPVSGTADVWWYRFWHTYYLTGALRRRLRRAPTGATVYAQCPLSAYAALRVRRPGQRVVMAVHFNVSQADEWAQKGLIPAGGRLYRSITDVEAGVLPALDGVVYVSDYMRRVLQERIPSLRHVPSVVIPNFLVPSPAEPRAAAAARGRPRFRDIMSIGSLEPRKNHAYLLRVLAEAAALGHRYELTVVGDGPSRRVLERTAHELGVADQVDFLGYRADVRSLLGCHRVYCHTALVENLPFAIIEAMGEGLPVIAGAVGGIPEMIRPGVDGCLWPLNDPGAAAEVLIGVLEDEKLRLSMASAARRGAERRWSGDLVGRDLLRFLAPGEPGPSGDVDDDDHEPPVPAYDW